MFGILRTIFSNNLLKKSYSQCGEDLIVDFLLKILNINNPRYLDIGTHHPIKINNTYLFYTKGCTGVLVEPNPDMAKLILTKRPKDELISMGVSDNSGKMTYHLMTSSTLNSFSKDSSALAVSNTYYGEQEIISELSIQVLGINKLLKQVWGDKGIDFLSIDIEGLEEKIFSKLDFEKYRPKTMCIETLFSDKKLKESKNTKLINFIKSKNYLLYADTYINSIFVDKNIFHR